MDIKTILSWAVGKLKKAKIDSPALDAEVLLSFILQKDKTFLFAHSEKKLTVKQLEKYKKMITHRAKHEPVAYITNLREFYGLDFYVDKNVLIPRPETELMVEEALKIIRDSKQKITLIDVGAGSGCVVVSIVKNVEAAFMPPHGNLKVSATDISLSALTIARKNARKHGVASRIQFVYSDLLENIKIKNNILITANLPYLTTEQYKKLPPDIKKYEPKSALVGGKDGLKYYRELLMDVNSSDKSGNDKWLLLEIDPRQTKPIKKILKEILPKAEIEIKKDLAGLFRLVIIKIR